MKYQKKLQNQVIVYHLYGL